MQFGPGFRGLPPVSRNIIIINIIVWVAGLFGSLGNFLTAKLGLHFIGSDAFNPAQIITYMFVHDHSNIMHILFNMFTLWMFGPLLERVWDSRRFLLYYFICGVGAAIVQEVVWALTWEHDYISAIARANGMTFEHMKQIVDASLAKGDTLFLDGMRQMKAMMVTVGASGAIFGLLLGFAFVFPNMPLYLFFIPVPIKAKYMVIGYAILELFLGVSGNVSTVAHFAHLGGMLFALIPLLIWRSKGTLRGNGFY
ncbi:MAG: rhomboid family intramembrane serine protease [Clostridium sp.]|nr:rhomboid family intramembrane serine protease [Prevotella sp.]MCM1429553.1 rhomboid family intramembrane serine protease [Clostridium sp.]MCM1476039.1 rhomboid family intramembrane serine protease [Muribaculaceae bacterium]